MITMVGFEAELDRHVLHVNRYGACGALLVLDLDHFETVNDTLGHNIGDELIVSVGAILRDRMCASDSVARLGGDEFAVLLPEADAEGAIKVAAEFVQAIRQGARVLSTEQLRRVTASIGVTLFRPDLASGEEALVNADLALYDAKEAGRERYALYEPDRHDEPKMKSRMAGSSGSAARSTMGASSSRRNRSSSCTQAGCASTSCCCGCSTSTAIPSPRGRSSTSPSATT